MITDLLDGTLPNLQDILLIQSSILEARDIYQPWRLGKQLLETKELEVRSVAPLVLPLVLATLGSRALLAGHTQISWGNPPLVTAVCLLYALRA
jgi:hypothetical protein